MQLTSTMMDTLLFLNPFSQEGNFAFLHWCIISCWCIKCKIIFCSSAHDSPETIELEINTGSTEGLILWQGVVSPGPVWRLIYYGTELWFNPNLKPDTHILPFHIFIITLTLLLHFSALNHHHYLICKEVTLLNVLLTVSKFWTPVSAIIHHLRDTCIFFHFSVSLAVEQHSSSHCLIHTCATEAVTLLGMFLAASPAVSDTTK